MKLRTGTEVPMVLRRMLAVGASAAIAVSLASCGGVTTVESVGSPAAVAPAEVTHESQPQPQSQPIDGVMPQPQVCDVSQMSIPPTTRPIDLDAPKAAAVTSDTTLEEQLAELDRQEQAIEEVSALGLSLIALCDGTKGYLDHELNADGCFTVYRDTDRVEVLGVQRAAGSNQVLHDDGYRCS